MATLRWPRLLTAVLAFSLWAFPRLADDVSGGPARPVIAKPLVAHWTFDDAFGTTCRDSGEHGWDAVPAQPRTKALRRAEGVFGHAMRFTGRHKLHIADGPLFRDVRTISLTAWVLPEKWDRYNEIFRKEDGETRVLFSFQNEGSILSLGLNVGGYLECDAGVDPNLLLDGQWHHCAATFDGAALRIFLDGKEIGSSKRSGVITAEGEAPGCIGSANGGECFQGMMDDLHIYSAALTAQEVGTLHRSGRDALARRSEPVSGNEPTVGEKLLAHWPFNERGTSAVIHEVSTGKSVPVKTPQTLARIRGVHGYALDLHGEHRLPVELPFASDTLPAISFSAWTRPNQLKGYCEIFRQECAERLLFSFQGNGTILSLGLNVNGYVECDATIRPAELTDGGWHHCAATFDGRTMRLYLDGREIGALERKGRVSVNLSVPAFIGSSSGTGEHFQGRIDDLRVYGSALAAEEVLALYRDGVEALSSVSEGLRQRLSGVYTKQATFAVTVAGTRQAFARPGVVLDRELVHAVLAKLRADFAEDLGNFQDWTASTALDYLTARGNEFNLRTTERLVGMMLEYKPLTEWQLGRQTPEERRRWEEADAIAIRFGKLCEQSDAALFSPEWIEIMFEAARRITFRPVEREAVAPYVKPATPDTRDLGADEAREALERDWLHQANRSPTPERIVKEIQWGRELAERIGADADIAVDFSTELAELAALETRAKEATAIDPELYFAVRTVKRRIMFASPVVDFDGVLFVDMPYPQGKEWRHETRHRLGYQAVPGARLLMLKGLGPDGHLTQLMPKAPLHGAFWRPDLSFDATSVLFCFKPHNEKSFHLYEVNVDGTGLKQLTDGPYDDFDPIYLPDGKHIMFSTTRGHTYVRCMPPTNAYVLARCKRDGTGIYLISRGNEPDYLPAVMDDGRIIYTRWEYTDKPLWRAQGLWTVNPDGTQVNTFWGNQSVWPDLVKDARSIPGSRRVLCTGSAHHNWFAGSVAIIDPDRGRNFPDGLTKVTADVIYPESGNGPVDPVESPNYHSSGGYSAYYSPYPLSEKDFLVSACRSGKFVLYLMDVDGNRELIYEGKHNILHALALRPRPRPPVIYDRVAWPTRDERDAPQPGVIYSQNVYEGVPEKMRGRAKFLRILNIEHKTYTYWHKRPYLSTGPVVSAVQSDGVKRVIGTVPIEPDGSAAFYAPSGRALHFQLLDAQYCALQTMRSFTGVMPGEKRGCVGCHELHSVAPERTTLGAAFAREPSAITPPPWGGASVGFPRFVQPVLDRYCGRCHQGEGKARKVLDLTDRPGFSVFSQPYVILTGRPTWGKAYERPKDPPAGWGIANMIMVEGYEKKDPAAYQTPVPMTSLSYRSRLVEIASSGKHHGIKVNEKSRRQLIAWIDTMCPYRGAEEVREIPDPEFQGVDWLAVRPKVKTAPTIIRPGPVD